MHMETFTEKKWVLRREAVRLWDLCTILTKGDKLWKETRKHMEETNRIEELV